METIEEVLKLTRNLAKQSKWQILYNNAKELKLKLFENERDLTSLQLDFLQFLNLYAILYMDFALGDIDEIVFEDIIYEDAYLYYKNKERREPKPIRTTPMHLMQPKDKSEIINKTDWVFKRRPK